ncbi:sensor histidine kinase [Enterococcus sp. 5H]|uniref:sensor histidine kinase n=1 Tax=Enterococcus sp. 5H TaxID=1229490 RepID=UPI002302DD87|nr:histidine kinase [Enterococcus sp. 5H]MDA9471016.1 Two-component sensor histidine kinase [Enterococcus sp. 5H]
MIKWIKKYFFNHQLFFEIMLIIMIFMSALSAILTTVVIDLSSKSYIDSYVDSNQLVLERSVIEYENLHNSINTILTKFKNSSEVKNFLTLDKNTDASENYNVYYQFSYFFDSQSDHLYQNIPYHLILIGTNQQSYYSNHAVEKLSPNQILEESLVQSLAQEPNLITSIAPDFEMIKRLNSVPTILSGTSITDGKNDTIIGYAFIELTEPDFSSIYDRLVSPNVNTISMTNQSNQILSSNQKKLVRTNKEQQSNTDFVTQELLIPSFNFSITSEIQLNALKKEMNIWSKIITITLLSFSLLLILIFFYLKKILDPLYKLIERTPQIVAGNFNQKMTVSGTYEIKKLISSYNYLQDGLNLYMQQLIYTEKEKRKTEFQSLQLHIKPHFIYNTLASIKFLIFANKNNEAVSSIDAFIHLLEQTIYNTNELITLKQELAILKDFSTILNTRYGNHIKFMAIVPDDLLETSIPKLLLQPFVENAFIHAFPNEETGSICVNARKTPNHILIEIIDTGVGFTQTNTINKEKQTYSGIGIHNVQERMNLFYNNQAELFIESRIGHGTVITIKLPL